MASTDTSLDELITRRVQADITQDALGAELGRMTGRRALTGWSISMFETGKRPLPYRYSIAQYLEAIENIKVRRMEHGR